MNEKNNKEECTLFSSPTEEVQHGATVTDDAVFGVISEDGPNYRNVCMPQRR
jgi:hypothetical protein